MAAGDVRNANNCSTGQVAGTGSLITVICGFKPKIVKLYNITRNVIGAWNDSFPQDAVFMTVDSGSGTTDNTYVTSNGINTRFNGFTIGTNASINTASDVVYWEAIK